MQLETLVNNYETKFNGTNKIISKIFFTLKVISYINDQERSKHILSISNKQQGQEKAIDKLKNPSKKVNKNLH